MGKSDLGMKIYPILGSCCEKLYKDRQKLFVNIKVMHTLIGGNPRHFMMWYQNITRNISPSYLHELLNNKPCPCKDAPNPDLFRKFVNYLKSNTKDKPETNNPEEIMLRLEQAANEFLEKEEEDL